MNKTRIAPVRFRTKNKTIFLKQYLVLVYHIKFALTSLTLRACVRACVCVCRGGGGERGEVGF